jgi:hypothetical protein
MGQRKRRRTKGYAARFIALPHYMLRSAAWKTLPANAVKVLLHIWERHNGINNGEISYSVREAEEIGLSKDQAARALEECISRGFLAITRDSAFSVKTKAARLWRLTAEPFRGERATKEFMRWSEQTHDRTSATVKSKTQSHQRDA